MAWLRCAIWLGYHVLFDLVTLCYLAWLHCAICRGYAVLFGLVILCYLAWLHCDIWLGYVVLFGLITLCYLALLRCALRFISNAVIIDLNIESLIMFPIRPSFDSFATISDG